jgi:hypothetical protein
MEYLSKGKLGVISMRRMVSVDMIENAFDEVVSSIDQIEKTMTSQIEIEINESKIAQLEKIHFVDSYLSQLDSKTKTIPVMSTYKLAFSR